VYDKPSQKSLEDARGYVVAEYQDYLEKAWNEQMLAKYPVKTDQAVFRSMVK
jgi:peptidyl-prolyl cis-trans isomerase SurA